MSEQADEQQSEVVSAFGEVEKRSKDLSLQEALRVNRVLLDFLRRQLDLPWLCDEHTAAMLDEAIGDCAVKYRQLALMGFEESDATKRRAILHGPDHEVARSVAIVAELLDKSDKAALHAVAKTRPISDRDLESRLNPPKDWTLLKARRMRALLWYRNGRDAVPTHEKAIQRAEKESFPSYARALSDYLTNNRQKLSVSDVANACRAHTPTSAATGAGKPSEQGADRQDEAAGNSASPDGLPSETSKSTGLRPTWFGLVTEPWWEPVEFDPRSKAHQHSFWRFLQVLVLAQWRIFSPIVIYAIPPLVVLILTFAIAKVGPAATWPWLWSIQRAIGDGLIEEISPLDLCIFAFLCGGLTVIFERRNQAAAIIFAATLLISGTLFTLTWANYLDAMADKLRVTNETRAWNPVYVSHFDNGSSCPPAVSGVPPAVAGDAGCQITDGTLRIDLSTPIGRVIDVGYADAKPTKGDYHVEIRLRAVEGLPLTACGLRLATDEAYFFLHLTATSSRTGIDYAPEMLQLIYNDGTVGTRKPVAPTGRLEQLPFVTRWPQWPGSDYATWTKLAVHKQAGELTLFVNDRLALQAPVAHEYVTPSLAALAGDANHDGLAGCEFDYLKVLAPGG